MCSLNFNVLGFLFLFLFCRKWCLSLLLDLSFCRLQPNFIDKTTVRFTSSNHKYRAPQLQYHIALLILFNLLHQDFKHNYKLTLVVIILMEANAENADVDD